ncbi:putative nitrogen fixation protein NifT [Agaribacterium haliotis]|uniref:putative nitrogen fixation protein NifT n=1 Tax=Agaribacterium haliotis TaxID=2013869 RepID=UPI000BB55334|nr:putative nitrogen fixation protein NifT [Agaribacterium haliotis]
MPSVMIRRNSDGNLSLYIAKKDLEASIVALEHSSAEQWGGRVELADGSFYYLEPIAEPKLPITLRAKRL